jgi:hypothetical protein
MRGQLRYARARLILAAIIASAIIGTFWAAFYFGLVPPRLNPLAPVNLSEPNSWFLDFRLAALKSDAAQCKSVLHAPLIDASAIADAPYEKGCGWHNAVRFSQAGGVRVAVDKMTCDEAAALTMWLRHAVQPAAATYLNASVTSIQHMGVYACRNIVGRNIIGKSRVVKFRSQHAHADAIDVSAFGLSDGRTLSVEKFWKSKSSESSSSEAKFLRAAHDGACRYFRVALGPDYNAAHANHFHLDRGTYKSCR